MGVFGNILGGALGSLGSQLLPIPGANGQQIGSYLGSLAPFRKGGKVNAYKALIHKTMPGPRNVHIGHKKKSKK